MRISKTRPIVSFDRKNDVVFSTIYNQYDKIYNSKIRHRLRPSGKPI